MKTINKYIVTVRGNQQFEFIGTLKGEYAADYFLSFEDENGKILNFNRKHIVCVEVINEL